MVALVATTGVVVLLPVGDLVTVVVGSVVGLAAFVLGARATVVPRAEFFDLVGALRRDRSVHHVEVLEGVSA